MKLLVSIILIALVSFVACLYLPWWSIAFAALLVAVLIPLRPLNAFGAGFLAIFLLWGILAFSISVRNDHILAHKVSLIILKSDSPLFLILLTSVIGALVGGFAALTGSYLRQISKLAD